MSIVVLHLMRTYGRHGGEHQLSQYLSAEPRGPVNEHFAFVYRDPACADLFVERGADTPIWSLWPLAIRPRGSPWSELIILLPLLPLLQLRFLMMIRRLRAKIIVVHGFQAALVAWPAAALRRGAPRFLYVHRTTKAVGRGPLFRWIYRPFDLFGGVSQAVTRSLAPIAGRSGLMPLENGVDWRRLEREAIAGEPISPSDGGPVIISTGRIQPAKGQAFIVEAFAAIRQHHPGARLWLVGDGPSREAVAAVAERLGVLDITVFWGHRPDVPRLLSAASVFAFASSWEGMSNAVLEAMAFGLPSVVVDAPGVSECHVDGQTGYVVPRDQDAFALALKALLDNPSRAVEIGDAARRRLREHYSIEANRSRFLAAYDRLLAGA